MKTVLAVLALLFATGVLSLVGQGDNSSSRQTLAGLRGVYVEVVLKTDEAQLSGLTEVQLRTDAELKLREAGIKVVAFEETRDTLGLPFLFVGVSAVPLKNLPGLYAISVTVDIFQPIRLERNPSTVAVGETWNATGVCGAAGADHVEETVRKAVRDLLDQFINAYLAVNPKR
jgi:hypothetical protein